MNLLTETIKIISDTLGISQAELMESKTLIDSLAVDSTEMVEILVSLETHFGVSLEPEEVSNENTPAEIALIIQGKKKCVEPDVCLPPDHLSNHKWARKEI